jgi:hypothetical protein
MNVGETAGRRWIRTDKGWIGWYFGGVPVNGDVSNFLRLTIVEKPEVFGFEV